MFRKYFAKSCCAALIAACGATQFACSDSSGPQEITIAREPSALDRSSQNQLSSAERFGIQSGPAQMGAAMSAPAQGDSFNWETPPDWNELPATQLRLVNFRIGAEPAAECYFSALGGTGGGLLANVNRWRKQFGLEPLSEEELAKLPQKKLLGGNATFVTLQGTFSGMGNQPQQKDFMLLGLIGIANEQASFVKLTAPRLIAEAQIENFDRFCASLKRTAAAPSIDPAQMPADAIHNPQGAIAAGEIANSAALHWTAPAGWTQAADRMMRIVTFTSGNAECYITLISGNAGGFDANINRWRGQMGQPALDAKELAALEKITVLGQESPLVEIHGDFTGMSGATNANYTMFGVICLRPDDALFIKMTGPQAELANEKENFIAFCKSLH